jgi:integrase
MINSVIGRRQQVPNRPAYVPSLRISKSNLPPILLGSATPWTIKRVRRFYDSIADIFEAWVERCESPHTQRAYRGDVMAFVAFRRITWPKDAIRLLAVSVKDVQAFRKAMIANGAAPKTINRRIASLSSFCKYLAASSSELRLPIVVPNPAHAQFIRRGSTDPRNETRALSATRARQLLGMPAGESVIDYRDRAILKLYLYSGIRLSTGCRLNVSDFHFDEDEATIRLHEKGNKRRTIGLHYAAAQAIAEYLEAAGIESGPLFRPAQSQGLDYVFTNPRSGARYTTVKTAWGNACRRAGITDLRFHDLRHTFGTRAADAGVPLNAIRDVMGHKSTTMAERYAHATDEGKRKAVEALQATSRAGQLENNCHKFATIGDEQEERVVDKAW